MVASALAFADQRPPGMQASYSSSRRLRLRRGGRWENPSGLHQQMRVAVPDVQPQGLSAGLSGVHAGRLKAGPMRRMSSLAASAAPSPQRP